MLLARILLWMNGASFLLYGLACLASPQLVAGYAGMELPGASAMTEVAAMYGGLQIGVGGFFIYHGLREERFQPGLMLMFVMLGSLALARTLGLLLYGMSSYNLGATVYESLTALLALFAMRLIAANRSEA
ncbi:MAG: DUF4345 family protein [Myxococcota bacterium]|nr:DUF4345 family protein [Myxococcota bacterium]